MNTPWFFRSRSSVAASAIFALASSVTASGADIALSGSDGTGYAAADNVNNEQVEPNTELPGSKDIDYPYYFDAAQDLWVVIAAEPLSAAETYPQAAQFSVIATGITDADFGAFDLGTISFDDSAVSSSGETVIPVADITLNIDATELNPLDSPRNVNNEFAWTYRFTPSNLRGNGLTFIDGELADIDVVADVFAELLGFGNPAFAATPGFSQPDALTLSGDRIEFSVDVVETQNAGFLGTLTDARLTVTRSGMIDAVTAVIDTDGDGIGDNADNCTFVVNPNQGDTDGDGYGNACDADFNDDCVANVIDLGILRTLFFQSNNEADLNEDGVTNVIDLGIFRTLFFAAPGPSPADPCTP